MKLILNSPLDMHLHLRDGEMLEKIARHSAETFAGGVIMPNTVPPIDSISALTQYQDAIKNACGTHEFKAYMTVFFKEYSKKELLGLKEHILGIKLYPAGATTNSKDGLEDIQSASSTLKLMEEMGIPLLVHGEQAQDFVMDREANFLPIYEKLAQSFPKLMIVMEHITTAGAVKLLDRYENLYATVTLQHLLITLDDVAGGLFAPHLFCKPIAKRDEDRDALLEIALKAHKKLSFGSDSAPHPRHKKECCGCAAGVFSAPIALMRLAQLFEKHDALDNLQAFVSDRAIENYKLKPIQKKVTLIKKDFLVPNDYEGVVPFDAGETLSWSLDSVVIS
jgi:dihydroorotase